MKRQIFKPYEQNQAMLLPPSVEELIPETHIVRVVNRMIGEIDKKILEKQYKGGGTSAYDPEMLLKVIVYAYTQRVFSSRRIAKELRENINYMWLSGMNRPDHRTINRFRGKVMKATISEIFYGVIEQLMEQGYVNLDNYFVDGTKIEANANRYTFVWRKSTEKNKAKLQEKVKQLLDEIDEIEASEEEEYGDKDLEEMGEGKEIDVEKLKEAARKINERLRQQTDDKELKTAKKKLESDFIPRLEKYEKYEKIFNGRNSFCKTDTDATFMRMKEDHMLNGQLKPGYNVQMGTENQFIVGYSIHQRPGDTACMIPHLKQVKDQLGTLPKKIIADAGYGSEENYQYLENENLENYVKFNTFHKEQKRSWRKQLFRVENWEYDQEKDEYHCPGNQRLVYRREINKKTALGYLSKLREYECQNCSGCLMKSECTKAAGNRCVQVNFTLNQFRDQARSNLLSDQGRKLSTQRNVDVESVFGRLKHNWGFRRFLLKGLEKVNVEWGILSIAHNIAKLAVV
jgi:transposase